MKMPFHNSKGGEVGSFYKLDKGNIEKDDRAILNIELGSMYTCNMFV